MKRVDLQAYTALLPSKQPQPGKVRLIELVETFKSGLYVPSGQSSTETCVQVKGEINKHQKQF
jgi:hypothetical protein